MTCCCKEYRSDVVASANKAIFGTLAPPESSGARSDRFALTLLSVPVHRDPTGKDDTTVRSTCVVTGGPPRCR